MLSLINYISNYYRFPMGAEYTMKKYLD